MAASETTPAAERGIAMRQYGLYLFNQSQPVEGRERLGEALKCLEGNTDQMREARAEVYLRWAKYEIGWTGAGEADRLLGLARAEYQEMYNPLRRSRGVARTAKLISETYSESFKAPSGSRPACSSE